MPVTALQVDPTKPNQTLIGGGRGNAQTIQDRNAEGLGLGRAQQAEGQSLAATGAGSIRGLAASLDPRGAQRDVTTARSRFGADRDRLAAFLGQGGTAEEVGTQVGQAQRDAGNRNALALAATARGGNLAAALHGASRAQSDSNAQAAQAAQIAAGQQRLADNSQQLGAADQLARLRMSQGGFSQGIVDRANQLRAEAGRLQVGTGGQLIGTGAQRELGFLGALSGNEGLQANLNQQTTMADREEERRKNEAIMGLIGGGVSTGAGLLAGGAV